MARILVYEFDEAWRDGLTEALRARGHRVEEAGSWALLVSAMLRRRPDLLLLPANLPDLSSQELALFLRSRAPGSPLVLLRPPRGGGAPPALREQLRRCLEADGTLDPELSAAKAAALVHGLVVGQVPTRPPRATRPPGATPPRRSPAPGCERSEEPSSPPPPP